jgi:hypothetical protein
LVGFVKISVLMIIQRFMPHHREVVWLFLFLSGIQRVKEHGQSVAHRSGGFIFRLLLWGKRFQL